MKVISLVIVIFGLMNISIAQDTEHETYWSGNKIMKGGFFLDGNLGYMSFSRSSERSYMNSEGNYTTESFTRRTEGVGVGINLGSKFYFGQSEMHRHGISIAGGFDIYLTDHFEPLVVLAPLNLGFTNIWKIDKLRAVEANLNFGPKVNTFSFRKVMIGINPEVRFRLKRLTLGLGYSIDLAVNSDPNESFMAHKVNFIVGIR